MLDYSVQDFSSHPSVSVGTRADLLFYTTPNTNSIQDRMEGSIFTLGFCLLLIKVIFLYFYCS